MSEPSSNRSIEILRAVLQILWQKPDGLPARKIMEALPAHTRLTQAEISPSFATGTPLYEKIAREATNPLAEVGWLIKTRERWYISDEGLLVFKNKKGVEAIYASLTAQFVDKREHNEQIKKVLAALPARKVNRPEGVRFMTIGSENDDIAFMAMVESVGSTIVIDDQCSGTRYFWNESKPDDDVVKAIADRYCDRPACPTKDYPSHTRFDHVLGLAKEFNARAAIFLQQKFCDPHEGDYPDLKRHLEANGIPTLFLEFDITNPIGPFRIRVEAFLETMSEEDLF